MMARFYQPPSTLPSSSSSGTLNSIDPHTGTTRNNAIPPPPPPLILRSTLFSAADNDIIANSSSSFLNNNQPTSLLTLSSVPTPPSSVQTRSLSAGNPPTSDDAALQNGSQADSNTDATKKSADETISLTKTDSAVQNRQISPLELAKRVRFGIASNISMRVTNICCNYNLRCHVNLLQLADRGRNVEYKRARGMVEMRLKSPSILANITSSGKVVCFAWQCNEYQLIRAARRVARHVSRIEPRVKFANFKINNTGALAVLPNKLDLRRFASDERFRRSLIYEPEINPGAEYRTPACPGMIKVFQTGSVKITAPLLTDCIALLRHFIPIAELFYVKSSASAAAALHQQQNLQQQVHIRSQVQLQQQQQQQMRFNKPGVIVNMPHSNNPTQVGVPTTPSRIVSAVNGQTISLSSNGGPTAVRMPFSSSQHQASSSSASSLSSSVRIISSSNRPMPSWSTAGKYPTAHATVLYNGRGGAEVPKSAVEMGKNFKPPPTPLRAASDDDDMVSPGLIVDEDDDDDEDYDDGDDEELVLYGEVGTKLLNDVVLSVRNGAEITTSLSSAVVANEQYA